MCSTHFFRFNDFLYPLQVVLPSVPISFTSYAFFMKLRNMVKVVEGQFFFIIANLCRAL